MRDKYAARMPHCNPEQFTPILVHDSANRPLLPHMKINESVQDGQDVYVQLIGPEKGLNDPSRSSGERGLWELFAYEPPSSLVPVTFFFDATEVADLQGNTVGIFGTFNSWGVPLVMREVQPGLFAESIALPEGAEICFKFVLNDKHVVSPFFEVVLNEDGVEMNYARVKRQPKEVLVPGYQSSAIRRGVLVETLSRPAPGLSPRFQGQVDPLYAHNIELPPQDARYLAGAGLARGGGLGRLENPPLGDVPIAVPLRVAPRVLTGVFEGVRKLSHEMQRRLFESDWSRMRISDLVKDPSERAGVKEALWSVNEFLRRLFRGVTSQSGHDASLLNVMTLAQVLHLCGIPDKLIAEAGLARVVAQQGLTETEAIAQAQAEVELAASSSLSSSSFTGTRSTGSASAAPGAATSGVSSLIAGASLSNDPFYVENKLTRSQLYEALVLIALVLYPSMSPSAATEAFLNSRILPFAIPSAKRTDIRARLLDPTVQRRLDQLKSRLWNVFATFSSPVRAVAPQPPSQTGSGSPASSGSATGGKSGLSSASSQATSAASSSDPTKKSIYTVRVMDENSFRSFLQEYSLHDHHRLRLPALTSAFYKSVALEPPSSPDVTDNSTEGETTTPLPTGSISTLGTISNSVDLAFPEFVELLARMCELKYGSATTTPLLDKLNPFLEPILQHKVENRK